MGLPKPGFEAQWNAVMAKVYADEPIGGEEGQAFMDNAYMACETLDAPVVGKDEAANAWALKAIRRRDGESEEALIERAVGYRVLELVRDDCDGLSKYSACGMGHVDETSLRGEFLRECEDVVPEAVLERAWNVMSPREAVAYGDTLAAIVTQLKRKHGHPKLNPDGETFEMADKIDFLDEAARWYRFWGGQGHPIEADY